MNEDNKLRALVSFAFSILYLSLCLLFIICDFLFNLKLYKLGILPLTLEGVKGVFLSHFIHSNIEHFISNSISLGLLLFSLKYFYFFDAYYIFFSSTIFTNFLVWLFGRPAYHIGSSGIVFFLISFFLFSGFFSKNRTSSALSLIALFLYGGIFMELSPSYNSNISWESHLFGFLLGIVYSFFYRNKIISEEIKYDWENEEESFSADELKIRHDDWFISFFELFLDISINDFFILFWKKNNKQILYFCPLKTKKPGQSQVLFLR